MGIERIDKTYGPADHARIDASAESQKDRGQKEQEEKDSFQNPQDKTDWHLLFEKSKLWKRNVLIEKEEVKAIYFGKINLKTDPSLVRVDIRLVNGEVINPGFVSVSRALGLQIKNLKPGDTIPFDTVGFDGKLRVVVPNNPEIFREPAKPLTHEEKTNIAFKGGETTQREKVFERGKGTSKNQSNLILILGVLVVLGLLIIWIYNIL